MKRFDFGQGRQTSYHGFGTLRVRLPVLAISSRQPHASVTKLPESRVRCEEPMQAKCEMIVWAANSELHTRQNREAPENQLAVGKALHAILRGEESELSPYIGNQSDLDP